MFGSNNLKTDPDGLILDNYTKSDLMLDQHVKSFVRPFQATHAGNPHFYHIKNKSRMYALNTTLSKPYTFNTKTVEYFNAPAFIAHYVNQSEESYTNRKLNLPRDDSGDNRNKIDTETIHAMYNSFENTFPKLKYAKNVQAFLRQYGHSF